MYDEVIRGQLKSGVIETVDHTLLPDDHPVHYLPHHCVIQETKSTKLRIVYDGSAKGKNNSSLNECLYRGTINVRGTDRPAFKVFFIFFLFFYCFPPLFSRPFFDKFSHTFQFSLVCLSYFHTSYDTIIHRLLHFNGWDFPPILFSYFYASFIYSLFFQGLQDFMSGFTLFLYFIISTLYIHGFLFSTIFILL
ncbi:unnamed protein product [Diatraea saccharalis]|uniref:Uncharacterized protein n=1 Tax=Diatraea saccharalis TaxID=40085 RepID=A0A9N9RAX7_9NEOP|nr:unnamed protein product [Diatraea saccharalis]